jgi:hypothetical protein
MNNTPGHPPFNVKPCLVDLNEKNVEVSRWQQMSEEFNFAMEDRVNDALFNEVIWKAVKGLDSPCPPAVRAAFLNPANKKDDY